MPPLRTLAATRLAIQSYDSDSEPMCLICHEPFDGELLTTDCNHNFHKECLEIWLSYRDAITDSKDAGLEGVDLDGLLFDSMSYTDGDENNEEDDSVDNYVLGDDSTLEDTKSDEETKVISDMPLLPIADKTEEDPPLGPALPTFEGAVSTLYYGGTETANAFLPSVYVEVPGRKRGDTAWAWIDAPPRYLNVRRFVVQTSCGSWAEVSYTVPDCSSSANFQDVGAVKTVFDALIHSR